MHWFRHKRVIVGSVAAGRHTNYGNRLIEQATLRVLGLPADTPRFSVFEPIGDRLLEMINAHDVVVITGCTTLQDHPGHQVCFDEQFERVRARRVCFGASFYCEPEERPSLRVARLYDTPIGARDPWTADYLHRNGVETALVGCPTLLEGEDRSDWHPDQDGVTLVSSTPPLQASALRGIAADRIRWLSHEEGAQGVHLCDPSAFDGVSRVITGRLHAALPALARGIPVRFLRERHWHPAYSAYSWGSVRYTLLQHLGVDLDGGDNPAYPGDAIRGLRDAFQRWAGALR